LFGDGLGLIGFNNNFVVNVEYNSKRFNGSESVT
jgi:hypothetical protein